MIGWNEAHLLGEWEIEKEDTTMRAIPRLIVDVAIRTHAPPGMSPVYFLEALIHIRSMRMATAESLPQNCRQGTR
jgi:hypothetical protein